MTTAVIVTRGDIAIQEPAADSPAEIDSAVRRIHALHPSAFRDGGSDLRALFVTLDQNQRIMSSKRIDLAQYLPAAAPTVPVPGPARG